MNKLARILLIDDSEADNFIHLRRLKKLDIAEQLVTVSDGQQGIDYLKEVCETGDYPRPEIIFLDINMPVKNGWEFLDDYNTLDHAHRGAVVVTMLTSLSPEGPDYQLAGKYPCVDDYTDKPLTREKIMRIVDKHFGD